jgi:hypothetical protein
MVVPITTLIPSPANLSGDFGDDLPNGTNKHIVWNIGAESYVSIAAICTGFMLMIVLHQSQKTFYW